MKTGYILSFVTCILCLAGCENNYLDLESKEELVVEGWIEDGHSPIVMVSKTLPASSTPRKIDDISSIILRYASVYIDHDGIRTYLTARLSDKFVLQNYFTSNEIKGEAGRSYTLHVEWDKFKASATCTIPEPCQIDTIYSIRKEGCDTSSFIRMEFVNNPDSTTYYQYFMREGTADTASFRVAHYGKMCSDNIKKGKVSLDVYSFKAKDPYFHPGDVVALKLATTEKTIADFWDKFSDSSSMSTNVVTPVNLNCKGNVDGALGYWAGYGISVKEVIIE